MIEIKLDRKAFENTLETFVHQRFKSVDAINTELSNKVGIDIELDESLLEIAETWGEDDFYLSGSITIGNKQYSSFEIYFIYDNSKQLFITAYEADFTLTNIPL